MLRLRNNYWIWLLIFALWGCSTGSTSRGGTVLYGVMQYRSDLQRAGNQLMRWPDRQQAAGDFKNLISGLLGPSPEFYRLVDLDLRKREFLITLRESNVAPERMKEMKQELAQMDEEIAALRAVVKTQLAAQPLHQQPESIDAIATQGLLGIAIDGFSASASERGLAPPSTKVGQSVVTDFGSFAAVRAPNGEMFRCHVFGNLDEGAGVTCKPAN